MIYKQGWRPKNWQIPWPEGKYLSELDSMKRREAYELGAEEMLKAIKVKGDKNG